jgi:hypothetical protein
MGNGARRPMRRRRPRASTGDLEATILADISLAMLDEGKGYAGRALRRLEELCALPRASAVAAHDLAATHHANLLAAVGRLDDAAVRVADGIEQPRRERDAMALAIWATFGGVVHLAAGRLSAARAAVESLPHSEPASATERGMICMVILAEVAARTDDRNLLQQTVNDASDAYPTGSSVIRRGAAHVLALAAWQRDDVHDAMGWLGGDITLFESPIWTQVLGQSSGRAPEVQPEEMTKERVAPIRPSACALCAHCSDCRNAWRPFMLRMRVNRAGVGRPSPTRWGKERAEIGVDVIEVEVVDQTTGRHDPRV